MKRRKPLPITPKDVLSRSSEALMEARKEASALDVELREIHDSITSVKTAKERVALHKRRRELESSRDDMAELIDELERDFQRLKTERSEEIQTLVLEACGDLFEEEKKAKAALAQSFRDAFEATILPALAKHQLATLRIKEVMQYLRQPGAFAYYGQPFRELQEAFALVQQETVLGPDRRVGGPNKLKTLGVPSEEQKAEWRAEFEALREQLGAEAEDSMRHRDGVLRS